MIITREILEQHAACVDQVNRFVEAFPDGCPTPRSSEHQIKMLLEYEVIRENWGWAVYCGIIPSWSMSGANLSGVNLAGANLQEADLREADLRGANLTGAHLHHTDLYEADLRGATLYEANLNKANLSGAKLHGADVHGAYLPVGFDAEAAGAIT